MLRLRGGVKTLCKVLSNLCPLTEVEIDVGENDPQTTIKKALMKATGIPYTAIKLRLGGFNQIHLIDLRTNIRSGTCGITMAVEVPPMSK